MMIDDRTPHFNFPLPNPKNLLADDVTRISAGMTAIDAELQTQILAADSFSTTVSNELAQAAIDNAQAINDISTTVSNELAQAAIDNDQALSAVNQQMATELNKIKILALAGL